MTRLQRLIKLVKEEQAVVRQSATTANVAALCRHQDRLLTYCARNNQTAPYELFLVPQPIEMVATGFGWRPYVRKTAISDNFDISMQETK